MPPPSASPSPRRTELLEGAYRYALTHGLADLSLRPLAAAVGSSPRVLLYLFGSKDELVRALLARARADELALLADPYTADPDTADPDTADPDTADEDATGAAATDVDGTSAGLAATAGRLWGWLSAAEHRPLLTLWVECYARSLVEPDGPWAGFARATVQDWLDVLATAQSPAVRASAPGRAARTAVLAVLRGALLDLLATGDTERTTAAVHTHLAHTSGTTTTGTTSGTTTAGGSTNAGGSVTA